MKKWIVGVPLVALLCVPLRAQGREPNCDGNIEPPRPISERSEPPEFLNLNRDRQGDCTPAIGVGRPGGVSVRRLAHKPSNKARKEFHLGIQDWQKGRSDQALLHLSEAARLEPDYMEAQAELGVVYAETGRASQALDHFERALALEPDLGVLYTGKAGTLVILDRPKEAEQAARRAVQLAPASIEANYMLGIALYMQGETPREAAEHLAVAAGKFPRAREVLQLIQQQPAPALSSGR
jgi:tetratricopeptide (TPR) repeat protein